MDFHRWLRGQAPRRLVQGVPRAPPGVGLGGHMGLGGGEQGLCPLGTISRSSNDWPQWACRLTHVS